MHLFTPNHVHLVSACYPPSAALLTSGPEYLPNSQELSRLTYYASNRPGKINKLSSELEKRVRADCRRAQAGNTRSRAALLITLYILKALAAECRRDISLLTTSLLSAVNTTLSSLSDLEVSARAATVFTAWTTYTDGHLIGVDRDVTQDYMSCLQHFATMGGKRFDDHETRNRTRLVGLAALIAAVHSEALYHSFTHFKLQVSTMVPALLMPLMEVDVPKLDHEASSIAEQPRFAFMDDFRTRPALERRAASIHVHIDGDKGPSAGDVVNASLHALSSLFGHSTGMQATILVSAVLDYLDDSSHWSKVEHCSWVAAKTAEWTQYQYRYAVPTRLVENLVEGQDASEPTDRHNTLAAMVTKVFTSPIPLVNLSTSDMISSLITLLFRRISITPTDALLPAIVECIASLGTHVYYADQIQDLAGELISRIVLVESSGLPAASKADSEKNRAQALRCLLASLLGLMRAADVHDSTSGEADASKQAGVAGTGPKLPSSDKTDPHDIHIRPSRRTKILPELWQDTLLLLCDRNYSVRADYAVALITYLRTEVPRLGDHTEADGTKRRRSLAESPREKANTTAAIVHVDATMRFLHALHAYAYVLATSSNIDLYSLSTSGTPERPNTSSSTPQDGTVHTDLDQSHDYTSRHSMALPPRARKTSFFLRAMASVPRRLSRSVPPSATFSDYRNLLAVLTAVQEYLPIRGLLTGVPMLLALDNASRADTADAVLIPYAPALQQLVVQTWAVIGKVWKCPDMIQAANQVLSAVPLCFILPRSPEAQLGTLPSPLQPVAFPNEQKVECLPVLDNDTMCKSLVSSEVVAETTGLDGDGLLHRLSASWSAETAFKDSFENTNYDTLGRDALSPLIKVAPALMNIENISLQSLTRSTRGVGVNDLRDALEGRSSISNPNLSNRAPSISTLDHVSSVAHHAESHLRLAPTRSRHQQRSKLAGPGEVRDVLNKLGIGKQNGASQLKSSFPTFQKPEQRRVIVPPVTPPYT